MSKTSPKNQVTELPTSYNDLLELAQLCTVIKSDMWQYRHVSDYMKNIETQITELKDRIWKELERLDEE